MSYILDALRKVERERQQPQVPGIRLVHNTERSSGHRWFIILLVGLVIINLVWLAYNMLTQPVVHPVNSNSDKTISPVESSKITSDQVAEIKQPEKQQAEPSLQTNNQIELKQEANIPKSISDLMTSVRQSQQQKVKPEGPEQKIVAEKQTKQLAPSTINNSTVESDTTSINSAPARLKSEIKRMMDSEKPEQDLALLEKLDNKLDLKANKKTLKTKAKVRKAKNIPMLRQLPPEFREQIPNININVYVYAEDAANAFVILNMRKYRIGDYINKDLKLVDIGVDSIVLSKDGKQFQVARP